MQPNRQHTFVRVVLHSQFPVRLLNFVIVGALFDAERLVQGRVVNICPAPATPHAAGHATGHATRKTIESSTTTEEH